MPGVIMLAALTVFVKTGSAGQDSGAQPTPVETGRALPVPSGQKAPKSAPITCAELGKELSNVAGVSLKRHLGMDDSWSCSKNSYDIVAKSIALPTLLESVSELPATRIEGADHLPGGTFDIKAHGKIDGEDVRNMVYEALGRRFQLRIRVEKVEREVLVLSTNKKWARKGFKSFKGKIDEPPTVGPEGGVFKLIPFSGFQGASRESAAHGTGYWHDQFTNVSMDDLTNWLESEPNLNRRVVNETNLTGRIDGEYSFTYRDGDVLPKLRKALARHGLSLTPAVRSVDMLIIEPLRKMPTSGSVQKYPVEQAEPVRIGKIYVVGNEITMDAVILQAMKLYPGQLLRYPELTIAEASLSRPSIFDTTHENRPTIEVIQPKGEEGPDCDLLVRVKEKETTGRFLIVPALTSRGLVLQAVAEEDNFDPLGFPTTTGDILDGKAFRGGGLRVRMVLLEVPLVQVPANSVARFAENCGPWLDILGQEELVWLHAFSLLDLLGVRSGQ
jgi:uncharacterized protein (TIGR03435 family)